MEENYISRLFPIFWKCVNKARFWILFTRNIFSLSYSFNPFAKRSMSGGTQIFLNISSNSIHSVWSVNVQDIWSASVFSCPGIWFAQIHIPFPNNQFQISLAISLHRADLVSPTWLTYEMAVALSDIIQITLLHKSLRKVWRWNLIASNSINMAILFFNWSSTIFWADSICTTPTCVAGICMYGNINLPGD